MSKETRRLYNKRRNELIAASHITRDRGMSFWWYATITIIAAVFVIGMVLV